MSANHKFPLAFSLLEYWSARDFRRITADYLTAALLIHTLNRVTKYAKYASQQAVTRLITKGIPTPWDSYETLAP